MPPQETSGFASDAMAALSAAHGSPFLADFNAARVIWGRADAWRGEEPTLAQRAWNGLQYSAAGAEQWGPAEQMVLESAQVEFDARQRLAFSGNVDGFVNPEYWVLKEILSK